MKISLLLVFVVGISFSAALLTDKNSNNDIKEELEELKRLLQEKIQEKNIENEDRLAISEDEQKINDKEKRKQHEQIKIAEEEREEEEKLGDEEKKQNREDMKEKALSSYFRRFHSEKVRNKDNVHPQTSKEKKDKTTEIDNPETIDPDDPLENLLEGMTIEENGKQHKVQGLHPQNSSKTYGDSHDSHKLIPEQQNEGNSVGGKRNFVPSRYLWDQAYVPYEIYSNVSTDTVTKINDAIKDISDTTCVQWVPQNQLGSRNINLNHNNFVRFINGGVDMLRSYYAALGVALYSGCWSYVGNVADFTTEPDSIQEISLKEPACTGKSTIIHEMLHAMGGHHEQSREDRDNYVEILFDNLKYGLENNNFFKQNTDDHNPYDAESALQYSLYSFTLNGLRTMKLKDQRLEFLADSADGLEFYDIQDITDTYRCAAGCSNNPPCQNGGFRNFQCVCVCPDGLTGATCTDTVSSSATCGGVVNIGQGEVKYIQSPNYGTSNYPTNLECTWLIKGTTNNLVRATVEYMDIAAGAACYHWLEYRYNLLGQKGPKRCGTNFNAGEEFWDSTTDELSNAMMIKFNSKTFSNQAAKTGFRLKLENIGTGCVSNPCLYGKCTSPEGTSSYTCTCDAGVSGQNCDVVSATTTIGCSFEYGEKCFLSNSQTDQFDWDFASEGTPTGDTGPSRAYQGYQFIFINSWGQGKRQQGDKAILVNSAVTLQRSDKCLTFYYHMYGSTVGTLKVYTEGTGVSKSQVFSQSGNKGNVWIKGQLDIPAMDNLKIYFEAIRGSFAFGDIALDDIVLTPGTCANPVTAAPVTTPQPTTQRPTTQQPTTQQPTTQQPTTQQPTTPQPTTQQPTTQQPTTPRPTTQQPTTPQPTTQQPTTQQPTTQQPTTPRPTTPQPTTQQPTTPQPTTQQPTTAAPTGPTNPPITSTETCTFERGTSCFMVNSANDEFDWRRRSGNTPSSGTGPSGAFEGSFYSYIEVSSPTSNGAEATLVSSASLPGSDYCLVFAYHMLGSTTMGDLVISTGVQSPDTEWLRIPGNQGNQWQEEVLDFTGGQNIKLFITANKGTTWKGDIAIDNLRLNTGVCSNVVGACSRNPCQNGGTCTNDRTTAVGYTCSCSTPWTGYDCNLIDFSTKNNIFCGFEQNENCVFQDSTLGDFQWTSRQGGTTSSGTGPSQAYEGTYYKYIEASSPRVNGEKAILSTESRQLASLTQYCLKFHYHMMGTPGSLTISVGERYGQYSTIWTMSGDQGDQWKEQQVQIDSSYNDPQIFIIAERGTSWKGDIAVDSISLKKETCQTVLAQNSCDFEKGESCIFTDSTTDDFNWKRRTGSTPSSGTGPAGAYSGSYYLYTEVSSPVRNGQKAVLTSENTQLLGSEYCLSMAYHRLGYPGDLIVRAGERGSRVLTQAWIQTGSQGSAWQTVSIDIPFYSSPVITIEGRRGTSWKGDTAIDDLTLKAGPCNLPTRK